MPNSEAAGSLPTHLLSSRCAIAGHGPLEKIGEQGGGFVQNPWAPPATIYRGTPFTVEGAPAG